METIKLKKTFAKIRSLLYSLNKALQTTNFVNTTITSENISLPNKTKNKFLNGIKKKDYIEKVKFIQYYCFFIAYIKF